MTTITRSKIDTLLEQGRIALDNAKTTPEILDLLTPLGYGDAKLAEGVQVRDSLRSKYQDQIRLYAQQEEATDQLNKAKQDAKMLYDRHYGIAKLVLKQKPELMARLGLKGARAMKLSQWIDQADQFYRESLADAGIMALLAIGGLDAETLDEGKLAVQHVGEVDNAQESAKGLAQQSTQVRNEAYLAFKTWMDNFWKIADVALINSPQWLERLGRMVRS